MPICQAGHFYQACRRVKVEVKVDFRAPSLESIGTPDQKLELVTVGVVVWACLLGLYLMARWRSAGLFDTLRLGMTEPRPRFRHE